MVTQGVYEEIDAKETSGWGLQQTAKVHLPTAASTVRRPSLPTSRRFSLSTPDGNSPSALEKQDQDEPESINYLAYGSNLAAETFLGRRGIKPLFAVNVRVPSLELTFDLPGLPYLEPCFANCRVSAKAPSNGDEATPLLQQSTNESDPHWDGGLIGVVYAVTPDDYRTIIATEGGGASYKDVEVPCEVLSTTSTSQPQIIKAHTLLAPPPKSRPNKKPAQASARYLALLTNGAAEHDLPKEYQEYLRSLQPYKITTKKQFVGAALFAALWLPLMMIVITLMRMFAGEDGTAPEWGISLQKSLFTAMWGTYDSGFRQLFGDGERTIPDNKSDNKTEGKGTGEVVQEKTGL